MLLSSGVRGVGQRTVVIGTPHLSHLPIPQVSRPKGPGPRVRQWDPHPQCHPRYRINCRYSGGPVPHP